MIKKNLVEIYSVDKELSRKVCIEDKIIVSLRKHGIKKVTIKLFAEKNVMTGDYLINSNEVKKIAEVQSLPEDVVEKFLKSKGSLVKSKRVREIFDDKK